ncbi:hypothetical protein [Mycobacteroides franklinii]|uniref:hypothetical protein n=1 Tax=Mycobacteroides franklinii TaxID=948102 RepID=UPI0009943E72|nr:hypothetical protein [Mycobacteroides franklinii]
MIPGQFWGVTPDEMTAALPCDAEFSGKIVVCDRAIDVDAPPRIVFAWLCQLRAAPYSYDLLDNFGRRSPRTRDAKLAELAPGQRFMFAFRLTGFEPDKHITIRTLAAAVTYSIKPAGKGTRIHVRVCFAGRPIFLSPLVLGDMVMMRKQLLTLKELAEAESADIP